MRLFYISLLLHLLKSYKQLLSEEVRIESSGELKMNHKKITKF